MPFLDSLDVANRALDHCGIEPILSVTEDSKKNQLCARVYDKVRRAEMRRNTWRFTIRNVALRACDTTTLKLSPAQYDPTVIYLPGAIVQDTNGLFWISILEENLANTPGGNNEYWDAYFGPMTADIWTSGTTYWAGELVYIITGKNSYQVFMSLISSNADTPNAATAWSATTTYTTDQTVSYSGSQWRSLIELNLNNTPANAPTVWSASTTYATGNTVTGTNGHIYSSVGNGNINHPPTTDNGSNWTDTGNVSAWSSTPTLVASSINWRPIAASLKNLQFTYPIGSGPSSQTVSKNAYHLPAGFLREAAQDPKASTNPYLGSPTGLAQDDWNFQGNFIVSNQASLLIFRFVADVTKVRNMDDMFCEGLGCRIASEVCEPLTQSGSKLQTIASAYAKFMGDARTVNAIEIGYENPPEDDLITCRY